MDNNLRVTSTDGRIVFIFNPEKETVTVQLACDTAEMSANEWEFLAKVYGKPFKAKK